MVLRETGAGWLASMMRAEREDPAAPDPTWLLDGAPGPEVLEALERLLSAPPLGELSRSD